MEAPLADTVPAVPHHVPPDVTMPAAGGGVEPVATASTVVPIMRTPKAPSSSRPARANRPSPLLLNFEARSPTTAAVPTPASSEKEKSPKSERRRPPALVALPSKADHGGATKGRISQGGTLREAHLRSGTPSSDASVEGHSLVAQALTPQPGSEGASTTASSTSEWLELQGPEELEYVRRLGQGSSGYVEKYRHTRTGKELALKSINSANVAEPQRKAILLELRTFNRCRNPHIVDFFGAFFHENSIHIGLEYMDAGALSSVLAIRGTVPENFLANITWQVLDGLEYLHCEMHVIHRDIKPSNLLLSSSGVVKITDFGVSGELEDDLRESHGKVTWVGTIYYMSPERAQGHIYKYDSDMWSLGLTLIECLCGRFPYLQSENCCKQLSFWELMRRIVEQDSPRLPAGYSPQAQDFIQQVMQKEPRNRASASIMKTHAYLNDAATQAELAAWIEQSGVVGEPQASPTASPAASSGTEPRRVGFSSSPDRPQVPSQPASGGTLPPSRSSSSSGHVLNDFDFVSVSPAADSTPMDKSVRGGANPFKPCFPCSDAGTPSNNRNGRGDNPFAQFAFGQDAVLERSASSRSGSRLSVDASPMAQSLRTGGDNPFLQRGASSDPVGYPS